MLPLAPKSRIWTFTHPSKLYLLKKQLWLPSSPTHLSSNSFLWSLWTEWKFSEINNLWKTDYYSIAAEETIHKKIYSSRTSKVSRFPQVFGAQRSHIQNRAFCNFSHCGDSFPGWGLKSHPNPKPFIILEVPFDFSSLLYYSLEAEVSMIIRWIALLFI